MGKKVFFGDEAVELLQALHEDDQDTLRELGVESLNEIESIGAFRSDLKELPPEIGKLINLQELDLGWTQISELPPEIGKLSNLQKLDLSGTLIRELPPEIGKLSNLQELYLGWTLIRELPPEIGELGNLQEFNLFGTQIRELPSAIGELSNLQVLHLGETQIRELPPEIGELSNLQNLDLTGTQISELPSEIGELSNLQNLDLTGTQISELPSEIAKLKNLQYLILGGTQIRELPTKISELSNLQELHLGRTKIQKLPHEIGKLRNLQELILRGTQIRELPSAIGGLSSLIKLDLRESQIQKLPPEIGGLRSLIKLDLRESQIQKLPPEIGGLRSLQKLYLSGSQIRELPSAIGELGSLKKLDLSWLDLDSIPKSVFDLGLPFVFMNVFRHENKGINLRATSLRTQPKSLFEQSEEKRDFIRAYYEAEKVKVAEGKVIFLGDGNAGKSHTVERIITGKNPDAKKLKATPGVSIKSWQPEINGEKVKINFWDFGGQEILHAMHRCFLTERSLYVVVLRERSQSRAGDLTKQADYWLENIRSFAPKCSVILASNREKNSVGSAGLNYRELKEKYGDMICDYVDYCADKDTRDHFDELIDVIRSHAAKLDSVKMEFPRNWYEVRRRLEAMSNRQGSDGERFYIGKGDYHSYCQDNNVDDPEIRNWLLEWFNDLGVCFSYHQGKDGVELDQYQVLNPEWLTNAINAIVIIGRKENFCKNGFTTLSEIEKILGEANQHEKEKIRADITYNEEETKYVLDVMNKFELCYVQDAQNVRDIFIPALCPEDMPEDFALLPREFRQHLEFKIRYHFLPNTVIQRLMIKCFRYLDKPYAKGFRLDFDSDDVMMSVRMDISDDDLKIDIYGNNYDSIRPKWHWLREHITEILRSLGMEEGEDFLILREDDRSADLALHHLKELYMRGYGDTPQLIQGNNGQNSIGYSVREQLGILYDDITLRIIDALKKEKIGEKFSFDEAYSIMKKELFDGEVDDYDNNAQEQKRDSKKDERMEGKMEENINIEVKDSSGTTVIIQKGNEKSEAIVSGNKTLSSEDNSRTEINIEYKFMPEQFIEPLEELLGKATDATDELKTALCDAIDECKQTKPDEGRFKKAMKRIKELGGDILAKVTAETLVGYMRANGWLS